jgi:flagellar motor switch protein FliM
MADERLSEAELETLLATVQFDAHPPAERLWSGAAASRNPRPTATARGPVASGLEQRQLRALRAIHENLAAGLSPMLERLLHARVDVKLAAMDEVSCNEFLAGLDNVTCLSLWRAPPLAGPLFLDQSPSITFPMIDRMLGGGREPAYVPARPLTEIELRLLARINRPVLVELRKAWQGAIEIDPRPQRVESRPAAARVLRDGERVLRVRIDVTLESNQGRWTFGLPLSALEAVWSRVLAAGAVAVPADGVAAASVEMVALLAETTISRADLENLCVGDIIATEQGIGTPISITVEGVPRFTAALGAVEGRKAVRIESVTDSPRPTP